MNLEFFKCSIEPIRLLNIAISWKYKINRKFKYRIVIKNTFIIE